MTQNSLLVNRLHAIKGTNVVCIGDAMLDRFVYGSVERISPEAPVPVIRIERESAMLGGAGNVVRNLVALGAAPSFVAVVGDDEPGREVGRLLGELEQIDPCLVIESQRQTTIKTRFIASSQQLLRSDRETQAPLRDRSRAEIIERAFMVMDKAQAVILSDYGKGVLTEAVIKELIEKAVSLKKPVIVDPKGSDYRRYRGATLLTPNRKELAEATNMVVGSDDEIIKAARHLIQTCGVENILVTRSQDGMSLVSAKDVFHLGAEAREVFDVSGAGDTVVATIAAALASGSDLRTGAHLANVAAGIVVGKVGTAVAYGPEIVNALHQDDVSSATDKVLELEAAQELVARWRIRGEKVGFTNGCFDLLHPGHISLLTQSRATCDRLVVGLNSDASVKRLKGETRPVQSEMARATVLASLACVDLVVIFDEDTPLRCIQGLKPDVLVKGADYTVETVVGAQDVMSWGGKVVLAQLVDGQSTTNTIKRMSK